MSHSRGPEHGCKHWHLEQVSGGHSVQLTSSLTRQERRVSTPEGKFLNLRALVSSSLKWGQNPGYQHSSWKNALRQTFACSFMKLTGALQPTTVSRVKTPTYGFYFTLNKMSISQNFLSRRLMRTEDCKEILLFLR